MNGVEDDVWQWDFCTLLIPRNRATFRLWFFEQPNQIPRWLLASQSKNQRTSDSELLNFWPSGLLWTGNQKEDQKTLIYTRTPVYSSFALPANLPRTPATSTGNGAPGVKVIQALSALISSVDVVAARF